MLIRCRKKEASKVIQTTKQHNTLKAVTFSELPRVGLEPTTLYTLDRVLLPATEAAQLAGPKSYIVHLIVYVYTLVAVCTITKCVFLSE